ncbi:unnamed protein product [Camellia sinensis]
MDPEIIFNDQLMAENLVHNDDEDDTIIEYNDDEDDELHRQPDFTKMSRNGKSFLKPGGLVQKMTKYEKDRKKTIQKNKIRFDALGIKSLKNSMFGSIEKDNSESCRVGKRKVGETDNDEDYQPLDDEGLSSSSDNGEPFDSQVIEDIHMGPSKKTNRCAARLIASQTPREKRSTVDEDTLTLPRRPVAAQVNHSESTPEVSTQPIHLPALHTRPDQLPTSATQPDHLSSPCTVTNSGASIPVLGKKRVRGPTRGKNVEKIRKERGDRIPVTLNRLTRAIEGDYATPLAAALGQQIRVHAPVRNDGWLEIAFGLRESIVTRVGQTFDFGDYNNDVDVRCIIDHKCQTLYSEWKSRLHTHYKSLKKDNVSDLKSQILYPCTKDDWEWMIDNLWETDDWKVKSENAMKARGCVKYNHTSGSRSFASRASIIVQGSKPTITKLFEDTHRRHQHGGVWIDNTAEEHHATMVLKIAEQSQPSVTYPLSEEQISREVLGKRSVYLKGYGIRKDSTSFATHFEAPNSEVIVLQQQLVDQRQQLVDQGKQLLDQAQNMSTMQTIIQMLAAKNGIDLENIPGLVPSNNVGEDASGVREDETSLDIRRDVQEIFKMTPHDKQVMMFFATQQGNPSCLQEIYARCNEKMRAQQSKFLATINSIINDGLDGSEGGEEACPSDIRSDTGEPIQDATANGGIDHWLAVEHPVTERIAEINLPAAQVAVGMGIPLWQIPARTDAFPAGLRVLVVDDDLVWLRILEKMLKKCSYEGSKYTIDMVRGGPGSYRLKINQSEIEVEIHTLRDGGLLMQLDGNSHVIYAEEEAAGTRLLIDGRTCLLQNDHDPPKLVAETPCKLLRYLVLDGSHVEADIPFVEVEAGYVRRIVFEGGLILDPDQGVSLPCGNHGLANSALPALPGDSQKVSRPAMVSTVSWPYATGQLSSANRETDFLRFREAWSLLHSAADVAGRSEILKAFPMHRTGRIRPNPESMFRVLSGMYFPGKQDRISGSARLLLLPVCCCRILLGCCNVAVKRLLLDAGLLQIWVVVSPMNSIHNRKDWENDDFEESGEVSTNDAMESLKNNWPPRG